MRELQGTTSASQPVSAQMAKNAQFLTIIETPRIGHTCSRASTPNSDFPWFFAFDVATLPKQTETPHVYQSQVQNSAMPISWRMRQTKWKLLKQRLGFLPSPHGWSKASRSVNLIGVRTIVETAVRLSTSSDSIRLICKDESKFLHGANLRARPFNTLSGFAADEGLHFITVAMQSISGWSASFFSAHSVHCGCG